jgi:glycine cleavage system T protein/glycine cleavage system H protein
MTLTDRTLHTPLHHWHLAHGARMVEFAGWAMPLQYASIIDEHLATRNACGMTDISHMGRLRFEGPGAAEFLAGLITRRVGDLRLGQIRYSLVTNDEGGILDDVLAGYYNNEYGQPFYVMVVNAGNRRKIIDWVGAHLPPERAEAPGREVVWSDVTRLWAMLAIQGPRSVELLQPLIDVDLESMRYYKGTLVRILHPAARRQGGIISRTGYTGEDGFELSIGASIAPAVWEVLVDMGRPLGVVPAGLGARDTLRLEAGMPLYGHERLPGPRRLAAPGKATARLGPRGAGAVRPARRPREFHDPGRREAGRPHHQRHLLADAREADCDGLRAPRVCPAGNRGGHRSARARGAGPGGAASVLSPQHGTVSRSTQVNPQQLLYSETHEWVRVEKDPGGARIAVVGIAAFALEALTDLVFVDLPAVGRRVEAGKPLGEIESVKAVSDIYSPVDGEIVEVNAALADHLERLAQDPYDSGWFVKIRISDPAGLSKLMDYAAYQKQCEKESQEHG